MKNLRVIAITHKTSELEDIGRFHISDDEISARLQHLKSSAHLEELMFLSTCNRVEFIFTSEQSINDQFLTSFFANFQPKWNADDIAFAVNHISHFSGKLAVNHIFEVASSIDSMVIGEREIITQVRNAYDKSYELGLSGDFLRILIRKTIETAKSVYTETDIATKPVSVVSLAYRKLQSLNVPLDARILIIGAGQTNVNMSKFLSKHGYTNFSVFNRTFSKAENLAKMLKGNAHPLEDLSSFTKGFDIIITCTGSSSAIIDPTIYQNLLQECTNRKIVIDLAIPNDLDQSILEHHKIKYISVDYLKAIAKINLEERAKEMTKCQAIIAVSILEFDELQKTRKVELAMKSVPTEIKSITNKAVTEVFAKEFDQLDDETQKVVNSILQYVEKKCISIPMKLAKEIILDTPPTQK